MLGIKEIKNSEDPRNSLCEVIDILHKEGPVQNKIIESLTYHKIFFPALFAEYEEKILSILGLFYKVPDPINLYSYVLSSVGKQHKEQFGEYLTPVQASVRVAVESQQYVSISAPTSAGKSFSIRDYIFGLDGDCVVIVPSRALIAEYIKTMKDKFKDDKKVMISSFVDCVFTERKMRRIFVLTPERARELFHDSFNFQISLFFFDEAQVSEEKDRGVIFDVLVRRVQKNFPDAKLIFAHPFVDNPDAQIKKHSINEKESYSRSYPHNTVGKSFIFTHAANKKDYYFSPYSNDGHHVKKCIELDQKFEYVAFDGTKSVLVYVSKASIYRGDFIKDFQIYVDNFKFIKDEKALSIIMDVEDILGANNDDHQSKLVQLLKRGVVIHHGSVPLDVRFLIEDFIRGGFAKVCFATSTLAQGINMPFDIVWLNNMYIHADGEQDRSLAFKNLIGRSGRLSTGPEFDFGFVYTKNAKLLSERMNVPFNLSNESVLDMDIENFIDERELVSSIREGTFDEEVNLPVSKVERLSTNEVIKLAYEIIELIYSGEFGSKLFGKDNKDNRNIAKYNLTKIYEISLDRSLLPGELNVFKLAIDIFFLIIQGRSFKEIVAIRYNYISNRGEDQNKSATFSQPASKLPDSRLFNQFPLFADTKCKDVSYDAVVFDTYDYLDTVISFSLTDVLIGAFTIYNKATNDNNALKMIELLKFGTNDTVHNLLIRYGFPTDQVREIAEYVDFISEENILFKPNVSVSPKHIQDLIEWYLP